ncbi:MAG TPA: histidine kinase [Cytophagales bacterium]|nr:histidine kinase [Cytophagales bacterium]
MKINQLCWNPTKLWQFIGIKQDLNPQLVLAFGDRYLISDPIRFKELKSFYPNAQIVMASTSGEIQGSNVTDGTIVVSALEFTKTKIKVAKSNIQDSNDTYECGKSLGKELIADDLAHILIIADGHKVNGSELVSGMNLNNSLHIPITGGLAGDGDRFEKTLVGINEIPSEGNVVAIGFYGNNLKVGFGNKGGWDPFGPERIVTKSERNILYELDNQPVLQLYKNYLGSLAAELPGSALLFPLSLHLPDSDEILVRTVLSINENNQSMTFAGNIPKGARVQLMKANFDKLIDGANSAASISLKMSGDCKPEFALFISCVGRKLVLSHRVVEEVEDAVGILGANTAVLGFYSYGEISPLISNARCELHNQTMTITTYSEC